MNYVPEMFYSIGLERKEVVEEEVKVEEKWGQKLFLFFFFHKRIEKG